jgi:hypothetical protein
MPSQNAVFRSCWMDGGDSFWEKNTDQFPDSSSSHAPPVCSSTARTISSDSRRKCMDDAPIGAVSSQEHESILDFNNRLPPNANRRKETDGVEARIRKNSHNGDGNQQTIYRSNRFRIRNKNTVSISSINQYIARIEGKE